MKKFWIYCIFLLLSITVISCSSYYFNNNSNRNPAATSKLNDCLSLFKALVGKETFDSKAFSRTTGKIFNMSEDSYILQILSQSTNAAQMKYLSFLSYWSGETSDFFSLKFVNIINTGLASGALKEDDAKKMTLELISSGNRLLYWAEEKQCVGVRIIGDYFGNTIFDKSAIFANTPFIDVIPNRDEIIEQAVSRLVGKDAHLRVTNYFKTLNLYPEDLKDLFLYIKEIPEDKESFNKLSGYIHYCLTMKAADRRQAFQEIPLLFKFVDDQNITFIDRLKYYEGYHIKRYSADLQIFEKYEDEQMRGLYQVMRKEKNIESNRARFLAKKSAKEKRKLYEKLTYGCRSNFKSKEHAQAGKNFAKFYVAMGVGSAVGMYTYNNYDKEKNTRWYGNLTYDIAVTFMLKKIFAHVRTNPDDSLNKKFLKDFAFGAFLDVGLSSLYSMLFGVSEATAMKKFTELQKSSDFQKAITELYQYMDETRVAERFIEHHNQIWTLDEKGKILGITSPQDLNDEDAKKLVLEAISTKLYEDEQGDWIKTGNKGADRYVFMRINTLLTGHLGLLSNLWQYRILCMGQNEPNIALAKAVGVYILDKIVFDSIKYSARRKAINQ